MAFIPSIHSFTGLFNKYLLGPYWIPETMINFRDTSNSYIKKISNLIDNLEKPN